MNIQDEKQYTIYSKDINGYKVYRLKMSRKNQDGSYTNGYVDIKFVKCEPPKDQEKIYLKNAWWSFYLTKDKATRPYIVCMEYETTEQTIQHSKEADIQKDDTKEDLFAEFGKEHKDDELELPF